MKEIFKDIIDYEGLYQVSNMGNVYSIKNDMLLKKTIDTYGYYRVGLFNNKKQKKHLIHRLVATTFLNIIPLKNLVCHKDGSRINNNVNNLYYGDYQDNWDDTVEQGKSLKGTKHPKNVLNEIQVLEIYNSRNIMLKDLANMYGVSIGAIASIKQGINWSWLTQGKK